VFAGKSGALFVITQLTVATCQFPVGVNTERNCRYVMRQMKSAKRRGAHLAPFPEACLSGYAGPDPEDYRRFDWELIESSTRRVLHGPETRDQPAARPHSPTLGIICATRN
jgi:predicted amidohydrolase